MRSAQTGLAALPFDDRHDAGRHLATLLQDLRGQDVVVLGLPRGGVPVAYEVAQSLHAPLDVVVVRKLGLPGQPEVAMGAIGEGGFEVLDRDLVARAGVTAVQVEAVRRRERAVVDARVALLRRGRDRVDVAGRVAVVVDDGLATGATAHVACEIARHLGAARVILAVPVASPDGLAAAVADETVCVATPASFLAVGYHYRDFTATSDEEVVRLLDAAAQGRQTDQDADCEIPSDGTVLQGLLHLPGCARGVVVFAHGSGSSRHSSRNRYVASVLNDAGLGTLLLDLLTPAEEHERANAFDIELLARRLGDAVRWVEDRPDAADARIGLFGASTGAGAALWAAADASLRVFAVVSRGGRPDLAGPRLGLVTAPTLLIVGSEDPLVLDLNRRAAAAMHCPTQLAVVPGATHLFAEPGTLIQAAALAQAWFTRHLADGAGHRMATNP